MVRERAATRLPAVMRLLVPRRARLGLLAPLVVLLAARSDRAAPSGGAADERWLEGRLVAPCCWTQTLAVHESPLARDSLDERLGEELDAIVGEARRAGGGRRSAARASKASVAASSLHERFLPCI